MSAFTCWPPVPPPGPSGELETSGDPIDISGAAPPVAGQVLTATSPTAAEWRVPGLHYDAAIRFNINALGNATIEPGTWGFVYTVPPASVGVTVFVVSSLTAPPVDSRFGLYVSPSTPVPVTISLVGASQIMGVDGVLATSIVLPGAGMYEWVFYHEDGAAIWGLVSDTHSILTDSPPMAITSGLPAVGSSSEAARADHVHDAATATSSVSGLMSAADKTKMDALAVTHASRHNRGGADVVAASQLSESTGPTTLSIGAVSDGQYLKRSGSTVIGAAAAAIETKVLASSTSGAGDSDLTTLGFDIAVSESVVLEWCLTCRDADAGFATTDHWKLQTNIGSGSIAMTRFLLHAQWTINNTLVATNQTAGPLQAQLHTVLSNSFPAGQVVTHMTIRLMLTNAGVAFNVRPYLQRSTTGAPVFAGSWGRCTRTPTVS